LSASAFDGVAKLSFQHFHFYSFFWGGGGALENGRLKWSCKKQQFDPTHRHTVLQETVNT
jgi:hypothetical protein